MNDDEALRASSLAMARDGFGVNWSKGKERKGFR